MKKKNLTKAKVNIKMTPGEMLKTLRELQELSQSELAELAGMSQSNISALESGVRQIGKDRSLALSRAIKVYPAVILFPDFDLDEVA